MVEGLHVRSVLLDALIVRARAKICGTHLIEIALRRRGAVAALVHHRWNDHVIRREVNGRFPATLLATVTI